MPIREVEIVPMNQKLGDFTKVAVVDDHSSLRELLVAALSTVAGFKIVGVVDRRRHGGMQNLSASRSRSRRCTPR